MKKTRIVEVLIISSTILFAVLPFIATAAEGTTYVLLAPLPDGSGGEINALSFQQYITLAFKIALGIGAALAVLMIVYGGYQYMMSDVITNKSKGKEDIRNAILGLVLLAASFLILNTLNTDFVGSAQKIAELPTLNESPGAQVVDTSLSRTITEPLQALLNDATSKVAAISAREDQLESQLVAAQNANNQAEVARLQTDLQTLKKEFYFESDRVSMYTRAIGVINTSAMPNSTLSQRNSALSAITQQIEFFGDLADKQGLTATQKQDLVAQATSNKTRFEAYLRMLPPPPSSISPTP